MPWFTTKGQICQLLVTVAALCIAAYKAWPDMKANAYFTGGAILFYVLVALVIGSIVHLILTARKKIAPPTIEGNAAASYHEARAGEFKEQVDKLTKERDSLHSEVARLNQHRVDLFGTLEQTRAELNEQHRMNVEQISSKYDKEAQQAAGTILTLQRELEALKTLASGPVTGPAYRAPLTIHSAEYGIKSGSYRPFTDRIRGFVVADSLNVPVRNGTFDDDPFDGDLKRVKVIYSLGTGLRQTIIRREYGQLMIPPDREMWLDGIVRVLAADSQEIADSYQELRRSNEGDARIRYPLDVNSWPHPDPSNLDKSRWDHIALRLYRNSQELDRIEKHAKMLWKTMELKPQHHALPAWRQVRHVEEVIEKINDFRDVMLWMVEEQ